MLGCRTKRGGECSVDLLCSLNCITATLEMNEDHKYIPRGPRVGQPWVRGLGVPQIWSTHCEENMSPLVVNRTPFSYSVHSGYDEYYLHIFSRGPWISDEQFLALHLKAVSMCQVIVSKVTKKCRATREYFTTEL